MIAMIERKLGILMRLPLALAASLALAACNAGGSGGADVPGDRGDTRPYDGITADETVHFVGTEPFWGGQVAGGRLTYETPENPRGEIIAVTRFAGRGGISFSGTLGAEDFTMAVAPGPCSDGMSDRRFPFHVMVRIGEATREGCGWTDRQPFEGAAP